MYHEEDPHKFTFSILCGKGSILSALYDYCYSLTLDITQKKFYTTYFEKILSFLIRGMMELFLLILIRSTPCVARHDGAGVMYKAFDPGVLCGLMLSLGSNFACTQSVFVMSTEVSRCLNYKGVECLLYLCECTEWWVAYRITAYAPCITDPDSPSNNRTVTSRWLVQVVFCFIASSDWLVCSSPGVASCLVACLLEGCPVPCSAAALSLRCSMVYWMAYAKEPEMSLVNMGWDVWWFTDSSRLRNQRSLYPLPPHLSELLQAFLQEV